VLAGLRRGETVELSETERIRKDGKRIWISLSVSPIRDASGVIIGAASIKRDVTEAKLMRQHLHDTQRFQAVGQLAGGIAHEANNQMSVVLGASQFLLRRPDLAPSAREDVELIRRAGERTASITQQLLAFSRRQVLELRDVDLNRVVQTIEPVLRRSLAESHQLIIRLQPQDAVIRADPRQLEQVLLNLTLNARDAMPGGGRLTIETGRVELTAESAAWEGGGPSPGTYAIVVVTDTGHGMDRATLQRAFEPFFTTKAVGQGTGLGLSVVHGIVNQTGGSIRVESEPGKGTTFTLYLPVSSAGRESEQPADTGAMAMEHGRVALVVEDDPVVRSMAARGLRDAGYTVFEAVHGREALELIRAHSGRLDVVVADIGMPEMSGYDLARCLSEERPDIPIVLISGYGDPEPEVPFLQKPFPPDVLVRKVGEILDR
jgi:signal transduction histidine kinase/CheY-like chemotaxis protein